MTDNVIQLHATTTLDLPANRVLEAAVDQSLKTAIVIGTTENGEYYFASSSGDGPEILWLVEQFKKQILSFE